MKRVRPMPIKAGLLISLDGPVAGSEQSLEHPIGVSGMGLNDWIGRTATWRRVGGGEVAGQDSADSDLLGREVRALLHGPSLSTSGETLTIEKLLTLRARTEHAGHGDEHEWSATGC